MIEEEQNKIIQDMINGLLSVEEANEKLIALQANRSKVTAESYQLAKFRFYHTRFANADNFTAELFRLMYKADEWNLAKLSEAFPPEGAVFRNWRAEKGGDQEFFKEYIK